MSRLQLFSVKMAKSLVTILYVLMLISQKGLFANSNCLEEVQFWLITSKNHLEQWTIESGLEHSKTSDWLLEINNDQADCLGEKFCHILVTLTNALQCKSNPCEEKVKFWLATTRNNLGQWTAETGLDHPKHSTSSGWRLQVDNDRSDCSGNQFCRLVATLSAQCMGNGTDSRVSQKKKRLKLYNENLTWHEAKTKCEKLGGNLAVPRDGDDIAEFKELAKSSIHGFIYIGFSDLRVQGVYEDIFGNEVKPYWNPHQPDNNGERCGSIFKDSGLMNDYICNARISFICEFDT